MKNHKKKVLRSLKALMGTTDELNKSMNAYAKYAVLFELFIYYIKIFH
jgi:hypothetical protein